jgi:hypothetical protein
MRHDCMLILSASLQASEAAACVTHRHCAYHNLRRNFQPKAAFAAEIQTLCGVKGVTEIEQPKAGPLPAARHQNCSQW